MERQRQTSSKERQGDRDRHGDRDRQVAERDKETKK